MSVHCRFLWRLEEEEWVSPVDDGCWNTPYDGRFLHHVQRLDLRRLQDQERDGSDPSSAMSFLEVDETDEYARLLLAEERHLVVRPGIDVVRRVKSLGKGGNGSVEMVHFQGQRMVLKTLLKRENIPGLLREIRVQRELAGAGGAPIVHGLSLSPARVIMTYTGPTYQRYIETCPQEDLVRTLVLVAQRLHEIHEKGFAHNDLKVNNITVGDSEEVDVHIIDFGLSRRLGEALWPSGPMKRRCWYAPELYERKASTRASDVYSFGDVISDVVEKVEEPAVRFALAMIQVDAMEERPADRPSLSDLIGQLTLIAEGEVAEAMRWRAKARRQTLHQSQ